MIATKPLVRRYSFDFSCLLRESKLVRNGEEANVVHGFVEGAHFFVEIDFTVARLDEIRTHPPNFDAAIERVEDLIERRFEGCPILATPLGEDDPAVAEVEALTQGRAYFMRATTSDAFAQKFHDVCGLYDANVAVETVAVRRAGDEYMAIYRETDDEA